MGVTLDELLESSGINSLKGEEKTASLNSDAQPDEIDLVSALRKLAADESPGALKAEAARELAEKTAEIMIITQTLQEIDKIASLGVEEPQQQKLASFIKVALDRGHSQKEIAEFLKTSSTAIGRWWRATMQAGRRRGGQKAMQKGLQSGEREMAVLREKLLEGSHREATKHLTMLEGRLGKPAVDKMVQSISAEGSHLPRAAMKYMPKGVKPGQKAYTIKTPGGTEKRISAPDLKMVGIGGAGLGTGLLLNRKRKEPERRGGVVVVGR